MGECCVLCSRVEFDVTTACGVSLVWDIFDVSLLYKWSVSFSTREKLCFRLSRNVMLPLQPGIRAELMLKLDEADV